MRLLQLEANGKFHLVEHVGGNIPPYAILSHTWGSDQDEVTFRELVEGVAQNKPGYRKLDFCAKQAKHDSLHFFWVDTCCIDKSSSAELSEAINSMFQWYQSASKCYVYLSDVLCDTAIDSGSTLNQPEMRIFETSRWFDRGWTLQELLAPEQVEFFSAEGIRLGSKDSLLLQIHNVTGISIAALQSTSFSKFSVKERLSWISNRRTKREEDAAYSLLGLFDVHMPLIYGEGRIKAFNRLFREIRENSREGLISHQMTTHSVDPSAYGLTVVRDPSMKGLSTGWKLHDVRVDSSAKTDLHEQTKFAASHNTLDSSVHPEQDLHQSRLSGAGTNGAKVAVDRSHPGGTDRYAVNTSRAPEAGKLEDSYFKDLLQVIAPRSTYETFSKSLLRQSGPLAMLPGKTELTNLLPDSIPLDEQIPPHDKISSAQESWLHVQRSIASHSQSLVHDWLGVRRNDSLYDIAQIYDEQLSARLDGTCEWIFHHPAYQAWRSSSSVECLARWLWLCAPAGHGKTVLSAKLIEMLQAEQNTPVVYFFASSHARVSGDLSFIVRSWIAQMARVDYDVLSLIHQHLDVGQRATDSVIWSLFSAIVSAGREYVFVLDGYDEYNRQGTARAEFLENLQMTTQKTASRIFVTSRDQTDIKSLLSPRVTPGHIFLECRISPDDLQHDITLFSESMVNNRLPKKDEKFRKSLAKQLAGKCEGMFLWVKLQQEHLRTGKNAKQLQTIVQNMPVGLEKTYERNWKSILGLPHEDRSRALAILTWTIFAFRALTVSEMTEALAISKLSSGTVVDIGDLPDEIDDDYINSEIVDLCTALVETREAKDQDDLGAKTIHSIHLSVTDFLKSVIPCESSDSTKHSVDDQKSLNSKQAHQGLTELCLRYLDCPETWQCATNDDPNSCQGAFVKYAANYWSEHLAAAGDENASLIPMLKKYFRAGNENFGRWARYHETNKKGAVENPEHDLRIGTPMYYAASHGLVSIVEEIWTHDPAQLNQMSGRTGSALHVACFKGHSRVATLLLEKGAEFATRNSNGSTPLFLAAGGGFTDVVELLIDKGADIAASDGGGWTPVNIAANNGHFDVVQLLVNNGADLTVCTEDGWSPLNTAANGGYVSIVKLLLEKGADITMPNTNGWNPIHAAASKGHTEVVELLIDEGADTASVNIYGYTPIIAAANNGHTEVVRLLVKKGADVTTSNLDKQSPLWRAALQGHLDIVKLLLDIGASILATDKDGWSPLYAAASNCCTEVARLLVEKGADLSMPDDNGWTPLHTAAVRGHTSMVKLLVEEGANMETPNNNGWTPLNSAAGSGHVSVVKYLLEQGSDMTTPNTNGWTPVNSAANNGHLDVVKILLEKGADITTASQNGWTPVAAAADEGHTKVLELLLDRGADISTPWNDGWTLVNIAASKGHLSTVQLLIDRGADISTPNKAGWTPINTATNSGHIDVVKLLVEKGADLASVSDHGWTLLNTAAQNGHAALVELLLPNQRDIHRANEDGWRPIHGAAKTGHLDVVKLLIQAGADLSMPEKNGWTPVNLAANGGHIDVVQLLTEKGAEFAAPQNGGQTPLWSAAVHGHLNVVKLLAAKGADFTTPNNDGYTPMNAASSNGHTDIVVFLEDLGADLAVPNKTGQTPLYSAALQGHLDLVQILAEKGADITATNENGFTPINAAATKGHLDVVKLLVEKGADLETRNKSGLSPLYNAALEGKLDIVEFLIRKAADVTVSNMNDCTILNAAASNGHVDVVQFLLDQGADFTTPTVQGWTPINLAAKRGHFDVIKLLVDRRADTKVPSVDGLTPLYNAALEGHTNIVHLLLSTGVDTNSQDEDEWTPVNVAAWKGHFDPVKLLVEKGADIAMPNRSGMTPLHSAAAKGCANIVELLADHGADIQTQSHYGWTPVNSAAINGHLDVVELLVNKGADFATPSHSGQSPLYSAAFEGHIQIAEFLLSKGADVTARNENGWTPVNIAASHGHANVVRLLKDNGADITVPTTGDWTPINTAASGGHLEVVKLLIAEGADFTIPESTGQTPLYSAAGQGHTDIVTLLISKGADFEKPRNDGRTPLNAVASENHLDIIRLLVEKGAKVSTPTKTGWTPVHAAANGGHVEIVRLLIESGADITTLDQDDETPLYRAALHGRLDVLKLLIEKGADTTLPNKTGWAPINAAADGDHDEAVKFLLDCGAGPSGRDSVHGSLLNLLAFKGKIDLLELVLEQSVTIEHSEETFFLSLLELAARGGSTEMFQYLRKLQYKGENLLLRAASGGSLLILDELAQEETPLSSPNEQWSPLHWACRSGRAETVEWLLNKGARSNYVSLVQPAGKWSPISVAIYHGQAKMLEKLSQQSKALLDSIDNDVRLDGETHDGYICNGCLHDIYGQRYCCQTCQHFDYCLMCKPFLGDLHRNHDWECIPIPVADEPAAK